MTNAQKWVAAFLALFLILLAVGKLTTKPGAEEGGMGYMTPSETEIDDNAMTLMRKNKCVSCHGGDLKGTQKGPSLYRVAEYYSRDRIINYLRNPKDYHNQDRFKAYLEKYPGVVMPSFSNVNIKDLGKIADYLIKLK